MKYLAFLLILLSTPTMWGAALSTVATAGTIDWKNAASWTPAQVPTNADVCTLSATTTKIQVTDAEICGQIIQNGTGASISQTLEIVAGGVLTVDGTNGQNGNIAPARAGAILLHGGKLIANTSVASTMLYASTQGSAGSVPALDICDDATCTNVVSGTSAWLNPVISVTGSGSFRIGGSTISPVTRTNNVVITGLGSASIIGFQLGFGTTANGNLSYKNTMFANSGATMLVSSAATTPASVIVSNVGVFNSFEVSGNNKRVLSISTQAAPATMQFDHIFCVQPPATGSPTTNGNFAFFVTGAQLGSYIGAPGDVSDIPGFFGYNCNVTQQATQFAYSANMSIRNSFQIFDTSGNGATINQWSRDGNNGDTFYYNGEWTNFFHTHHFVNTTAPTTGAPDDIDNYWVDNQSFIMGGGESHFDVTNDAKTISHLIHTYGGGFVPGSNLTGDATTYTNVTFYDGTGVNVNHGPSGGTSSNSIIAIHNMIFSTPFYPGGVGAQLGWIFGQDNGFVRQNFSGGVNQNLFWQVVGSPEGLPFPANAFHSLSNAALGTVTSYFATTAAATPIETGSAIGSGGTPGPGQVVTTSNVTTGFGAVQAGDFFTNPTAHTFDVIASVTPGTPITSITLQNGCSAAFTTGCNNNVTPGSTGWSTFPGFSAAGNIYGVTSGFGTGDFNLNPGFFDPTRSACTYALLVGVAQIGTGGTSSGCPFNGLNAFGGISPQLVNTSTTPTSFVCPACDFVSWGIGPSDVIEIWNSLGTILRCEVTVTAVVDLHTLTIPSCTGLANNDIGFFTTGSINLSRYIMRSFGWTFTGLPGAYTLTAVTPNNWTFRKMYEWVRLGFTPYNGQLSHAGAGGADMGAVPVYPAAITTMSY